MYVIRITKQLLYCQCKKEEGGGERRGGGEENNRPTHYQKDVKSVQTHRSVRVDYRMLKLPDFIHSAEDLQGSGKQSRTRSTQTGRGIQSPLRPKAVTACGGVVAVVRRRCPASPVPAKVAAYGCGSLWSH